MLRSIRNGESFANVAVNNSDGPSASNGGQLPEFTYNDMVEPFSKYVFSRRKGSLGIAETPFGFHIIEIQDKYDAVKFAKTGSEVIGGKGGGGRKDFAQAGGQFNDKIDEAFEKIVTLI